MVGENPLDIYKDKKVLVTGHTGFKGAWLSIWLHSLGAKVAGYALEPPSKPSLFEQAGLAEKIESTIGDIRDHEKLSQVVKDFQPDIVFHLAAQPLVLRGYEEPLYTFDVNVMGSGYLLQTLRDVPNTRVCLITTTDKCYENKEWPYAYRENDSLGGHDPYSASKAAAEILIHSFRESFLANRETPLSVATTRAGNVIGGGDWADNRLVPDCIRSFQKGEKPTLRYPGAIRPWQLVLEPLYGYLILAAKQWTAGADYDGAWNFGPAMANHVPVSRIVDLAHAVWTGESEKEQEHQLEASATPHEASILRLDCSKSHHLLGWSPALGIEDTMQWTVDWYSKSQAADAETCWSLCLEQIGAYRDLRAKPH